MTKAERSIESLLLAVATAGLVVGTVLYIAGARDGAQLVWAMTSIGGLAAATWWVIDAARRRRLGADALAVLALAGTLVIGEYFAGAVITLMLASGRALEARASARARRELGALLERAPRVVHRYEAGELTRAAFIRRIGRVLDDLDPTGPDEDDVIELRRLLYGLHAVLQLHFAQEDEGYLSLADETETFISSTRQHDGTNVGRAT